MITVSTGLDNEGGGIWTSSPLGFSSPVLFQTHNAGQDRTGSAERIFHNVVQIHVSVSYCDKIIRYSDGITDSVKYCRTTEVGLVNL